MLDAGLVLYVGLLVLGAWRWLSGWRLCGKTLEYTNYCVLLYLMLLLLLVHSIYNFLYTALHPAGKAAWDDLPRWIRPLMLAAPIVAVFTFVVVAAQTAEHVNEIRKGSATLKHDRAVQIIALPAVYGIMAMSALAGMYRLSANLFDDDRMQHLAPEERRQLFLSKSETCFWVGDLYEAWALYQFGKLSLELIRASMWKMRSSPVAERREAAQALITAHSAVEAIAWLGITLFLGVCVLQAGWSLYLLTFTGSKSEWASYNSKMSQFRAAGMVASAGAIYNVHVVESTFHEYFDGYKPLLKFVTVKIIVSFAFFQKGCFWILQALKQTLPDMAQNLVNKVPFLGDMLNFTDAQFDLFYDSLIVIECFVIALLHWCAWSAYEPWYQDDDEKGAGAERDGERKPLLAQA